MKLVPVALALFFRKLANDVLEVWVQRREDDGPFHGLLEFPGGGIETDEAPLTAAVREVEEEVGIKISASDGKLLGAYPNNLSNRTILLYVFLFPDQTDLKGKGQWLSIDREGLSKKYLGMIPPANHLLIDDLYRSLYD